MAAVGLVVGAGIGCWAGHRWGQHDLLRVMEMPQGGLYLSHATNTVFQKLTGSQVSWLRIPDPEQAQLVKMFATDPTTTTTTLPKETKP